MNISNSLFFFVWKNDFAAKATISAEDYFCERPSAQ